MCRYTHMLCVGTGKPNTHMLCVGTTKHTYVMCRYFQSKSNTHMLCVGTSNCIQGIHTHVIRYTHIRDACMCSKLYTHVSCVCTAYCIQRLDDTLNSQSPEIGDSEFGVSSKNLGCHPRIQGVIQQNSGSHPRIQGDIQKFRVSSKNLGCHPRIQGVVQNNLGFHPRIQDVIQEFRVSSKNLGSHPRELRLSSKRIKGVMQSKSRISIFNLYFVGFFSFEQGGRGPFYRTKKIYMSHKLRVCVTNYVYESLSF